MTVAEMLKRIPAPHDGDVNTGVEPCPTSYLIQKYGLPRKVMPKDCISNTATNPFWKDRFVTASVGPFKVTGHRKAVALLEESLSVVKHYKPWLYNELGTAGMLCIRHVRGHPNIPSNHALGLAVDFTIHGELDNAGDGLVQTGLLELYKILKTMGWFWGVEFAKEDAMHFEVSSAVVRKWIKEGTF